MFTNKKETQAAIRANVDFFTRDSASLIKDPLKMQTTFHMTQRTTCDTALMFWLDPSHPPKKVQLQVTRKSGA